MCGIICQICNSEDGIIYDTEIMRRINNRGPNSCNTTTIKVNGKNTNIAFTGSVLWMQGSSPTPQPVENDKGILLYNGDIFDENWDDKMSDTEQIMNRFSKKMIDSSKNVIEELKNFKGPFSIIYYNKKTCELLFTRDMIGRNSLLLCKHENTLLISSVLGRKYDCVEIPASHIYVLNVVTNKLKMYTWENEVTEFEINDWIDLVKNQQRLSDEEFYFNNETNWNLDDKDDVVQFIEEISLKSLDKSTIFQKLLDNPDIKSNVLETLLRLDKSVMIRLKRQPKKCKDCLDSLRTCNHSSVGILFSGGLDCTILAFLADKYVEKNQSIDLINVAFKKDNNSTYEVPDRLTGIQSLEELRRACPDRNWIFKEINVPKDKLIQFQKTVIGDLVYPRQTILDESLGSALWFAAEGLDDNMQSPCRVLLLGSGADELFGGYTRHRNAFRRRGWTGLNDELLLDWKRISFRNLARDNRVICDHGRQPRIPYLDEDFTNFILNLKPWFKCFPNEHLGPGIGDKLFLRLVAFHIGLKNAASLPKRALQFGSRIANKKEKGSDISINFVKLDLIS